jgi:NitT/TauT family transport system substrate-binding protein
MHILRSRRDFLAGLSAAGAASALGARTALADEGSPEVTTLRLQLDPGPCIAPMYLSEDLLRAEGFTDIRYIRTIDSYDAVRGKVDLAAETPTWIVSNVDAGAPVTALAGVHSGCYELFAHDSIGTLGDLKGKRVAIRALGSGSHLYLSTLAAHIGLDPHKDINWIVPPSGTAMQLFVDGQVDAYLAFPPEPQELRARKVGRVILNTATDKPWSEYFCCTVFSTRDFVHAYPIATKRALRAILKTADICAAEPEKVARRLVEANYTPRYDYAVETLTEIPYVWREFDLENSLRFFALRLHEVGMVKSTPNQIIAEGTDWRFLNELKRELKA